MRSRIDNNFSYHAPPNDATRMAYERLREMGKVLALLMNELVPQGREAALAQTKLEEAVMWANAGIARAGGIDDGDQV